MNAIKFLLLVIGVLLSYTLGYIFTETKFDLARYDLFDFQAFKCRACLSFHLCWVINTFVSLLFNDWIMVTVGVVFAAFLFIGLKIDENNRFIN